MLSAHSSLAELGAHAIESGGVRIWTFNKVPESQIALVQWQNVVSGPEQTIRVHGRKRVVRGKPIVTWKMEVLHLPEAVSLKEAKLVSSRPIISGTAKKPVYTECPRALILAGNDRAGNAWLSGYRLSSGGWVGSADIFSAVPPFLLQNLAGKVSFSGNDLVLAVGTANSLAPEQSRTAPVTTQSSGYRIVLRFFGGKYSLEGKAGEEGPLLMVNQFAQALQQNRTDLAKGLAVRPEVDLHTKIHRSDRALQPAAA